MESRAYLMIFCGICRKFDKFHGKQQNAMANLETGNFEVEREKTCLHQGLRNNKGTDQHAHLRRLISALVMRLFG